jgi:hypothetical protein
LLKRQHKKALFSGYVLGYSTVEKMTFDDGPTPKVEWVLNQLEKLQRIGYIFCIGKNIENSVTFQELLIKDTA